MFKHEGDPGRAAAFATRVVTGILCFGALALVLGYAVELLWNSVVISVFAVRRIDYWQAVGLLALCRLLVGGLHSKHSHKRCGCRRRDEALDGFVERGR